MSSLDDFITFNKEVATSDSTSEGGGPMHYNDTYGGRHPVKNSKDHYRVINKLMKDEDEEDEEEVEAEDEEDSLDPTPETVMVSSHTAPKAFGNDKTKIKESSGIERVGRWLEDHSPSMAKAYGEQHLGVDKVTPNKRRLIPNTSMGTSGRSMSSTYNDGSHSTVLHAEKDGDGEDYRTRTNNPKRTTLVGKDDGLKNTIILSTDSLTELVKWATTELRKDNPDPYDIERNSQRTKLMRSGDRNYKNNGSNSPTTETTVPEGNDLGKEGLGESKIPKKVYPSMGQAGKFEAHLATYEPAGKEGMNVNANAVNLAPKGQVVRRKNEDPTQKGAYIAQANQGGYNFMGMEKGIASGGTPHLHSIVSPIHGGEKDQTKKYIEGESHIDEDNIHSAVEERMEEKRKRDKKDAEPGMDGPSLDDAGGVMSELGNPIAQLMEKQGFDYESDALHRGGTLDEDEFNDEPTEEDDAGWAIEEEVKQEIAKEARGFYVDFLAGRITKDMFGKF